MSQITNTNQNTPPLTFNEKLKSLNKLKHDIKKKRIFLDESKQFFGFDNMTQLIKVKNTSEVKGYPFLINNKNHRFGLKVIPIETKYEKYEHPSFLEFNILNYLTENIVNKNISPHFVHFLGQFKISNKARAIKHLNLKRLEVENLIRTHSNVVISEFVEGKSLDNWLHDTYENDDKISDIQWKIITFQLVYTIYVMQAYYKLMHNDFHYGNILIDNTIKSQPGSYYVYKLKGKEYYIPNTGILPKLFDFEYAMAYSNSIENTYPNKFIMSHYIYNRFNHTSTLKPNALEDSDYEKDNNVPCNYNEIYDLHYFLTSLLDLFISEELFNWIINTYPNDVIPPEDDSISSTSSTLTTSTTSKYSSVKNSRNSSNGNSSISGNSSVSGNSNTSNSSDSRSSYTDTDSDTKSSSNTNEFIKDGRLINDIEKLIQLPKPLELLQSNFFKEFLIKPNDFNASESFYFTCDK